MKHSDANDEIKSLRLMPLGTEIKLDYRDVSKGRDS